MSAVLIAISSAPINVNAQTTCTEKQLKDLQVAMLNCTGDACAISATAAGTLPPLIPEPYNGAFTAAGTKHKVSPALVAALFTEENFTHTQPADLAARWASFIKSHPDPNSGWPVSPDNAQGPFQFIPSTWAAYGEGGNINHLADAANGAANYVAANGATIDKPPSSWQNAIFAYNHAQWYVDAVMLYYNFYNNGGGAASNVTTPASASALCGVAAATGPCSNNLGPSTKAVPGNLFQTILVYAWCEYHSPPYTNKKPPYEAAIQAAQGRGEYVGGGQYPGVDCGGFVTRAMRDSGTDPDYNAYQSNVVSQWRYVEDHPEKYQRLTGVSGTGQLQPGDIFFNGDLSHTYFYVGSQPNFKGNSASASFSTTGASWRAPMASTAYDISSATWYRPKMLGGAQQ